MNKIILPSSITEEICNGLPSPCIRKVTSVLAVMHPNNEDVVILKSRHKEVVTLELKITDFELYSQPLPITDDYRHLEGRNIILSREILSNRSLRALMTLDTEGVES
jgi:hypothetical protein